MNKLICSIILCILVIGSIGCTTSTVTRIYEFENTGSDIENYKLCHDHAEEQCENNSRCVGFTVRWDDIICEGNKCIC